MSKMRSSSSSHSPLTMLKSRVREALVTSVTWRLPLVRCQMSQLSTVPKASSPRSARARAPATWSRIQRDLGGGKIGVEDQAGVRLETTSPTPRSSSSLQNAAVRRSCHTMAGWMGLPVARSHTMTVSRWLVMPMAATSRGRAPALPRASTAQLIWLVRISMGSCSTQPACG